jgi:hypothetical protein
MAPRKPPATTEEVLAAVAEMSERNTTSVRFYSAMTIAGLVARQRGCPEAWPDKGRISEYVAFSSVKRKLQDLVATGKLYAIDGSHWAVPMRSARVTFYVDDRMRNRLIRAKTEREESKRFAERAEWVSGKLHKRYAMIVEELTNEWDRDNPPEDWEARW